MMSDSSSDLSSRYAVKIQSHYRGFRDRRLLSAALKKSAFFFEEIGSEIRSIFPGYSMINGIDMFEWKQADGSLLYLPLFYPIDATPKIIETSSALSLSSDTSDAASVPVVEDMRGIPAILNNPTYIPPLHATAVADSSAPSVTTTSSLSSLKDRLMKEKDFLTQTIWQRIKFLDSLQKV